VTGSSGAYSFPSLIPGEYTINATKVNTSTGNLDYLTEQTITLAPNSTTWINISLTYAPVAVSGYTTHNSVIVGAIPITYSPDKTVTNNTATKQTAATSDKEGFYNVKLTPGAYNVTVKKTEGATTVYSFTGKLSLYVGEGSTSYDIALTKESVTVSGSTLYSGVGKANVTVYFKKDSTIANNTAIAKSVKTDRNGTYTVELMPGSYNVSITELVNESGVNVTYSGTGHLSLFSGNAPKVFDIILTREQAP